MGKLSELILNENRINPRARRVNVNPRSHILTQLGHNIYATDTTPVNDTEKPKRKRKPLTPEQKESARLKREETKKQKEQEKEELIRLRIEKEIRDSADLKKKEDELKKSELDLKEKERQAELDRKKKEIEKKEQEDYKDIIEQNRKRQEKYNASKASVKPHEQVNEPEKKKQSSGLVNMAARSIRF